MKEPVKVSKNPEWASGSYHYEFKNSEGNTKAATGLTFDELMYLLGVHFGEWEIDTTITIKSDKLGKGGS